MVCAPHTVNELVTDIVLKYYESGTFEFTLLHIGSRLFELFSKEVCLKQQPGMHLIQVPK